MSGYSKMRSESSIRSRSIDFLDLPFSQIAKLAPNPASAAKPNEIQEKTKTQKPISEEEPEEEDGERFGAILSRNLSVSAAAAARRSVSEAPSSVKSVAKRAFSMRRSSSVGEGYCRIHDQFEALSPPPRDAKAKERSGRRKLKLMKACKKLFPFF